MIKIKTSKNYSVYTFYNQDHSLGNILKYIINSNPLVDYVGYNIPNPSENILYLKISSKNNEQTNHLMLGLKNSYEIGVSFDNLFSTKMEKRKDIFSK